MKLLFSKPDLWNAIQMVQSSVPTRSTLPILSNILLQVEKSGKSVPRVRLEATDLEVGIRVTVKAEIHREGRVTIPAKKFGEIVREMPDGQEIEISSADGKK